MASRIAFFLLSILSSGIANTFDFPFNLDSKDIQWPSCDELRDLWLTLRRITYHGEITNEIPLIPTDLLRNLLQTPHQSSHSRISPISDKQRINYLFPTVWSKDKNHIRPTKVNKISDSFPQKSVDVLQPIPKNPILQSEPLNNIALERGEYFEGFDNAFLSPEEVLSFPGEPIRDRQSVLLPITVKESNVFGSVDTDPEQIPNFDGIYGLEEEVGSFGNFYNEDKPQSQRKPDIRTVKISNIKWHNQPTNIGSRSEKPSVRLVLDTCDVLEEKSCSTNDHCECVGWETLRCISGKCSIIHDIMTGRVEEIGTWHDGPLPSSQLGRVNQKRRRGKRSKSL